MLGTAYLLAAFQLKHIIKKYSVSPTKCASLTSVLRKKRKKVRPNAILQCHYLPPDIIITPQHYRRLTIDVIRNSPSDVIYSPSIGIGDVCQIDLECSRQTEAALCNSPSDVIYSPSAGIGDVCQIDLEWSRQTEGALCNSPNDIIYYPLSRYWRCLSD